MTTTTSAERVEFRAALRGLFAERSPDEHVRRFVDGGPYDRGLWSLLAAQAGLAGILVPEELGGQGLTHVESGVALQEAARALVPAPVLSTAVLVPTAVLAAGDETAAKRILPGIADGSTIATLALDDASGETTCATGGGSTWQLTGHKVGLLDGPLAGILLVVARVGEEVGLFAVDSGEPGVECEDVDVLDLTRRQSRLRLTRAAAVRLGGDYTAGLTRLRHVAAVAAAAEQLGLAERLLEIAVDYARTREQFGRPIGSFQAVQHLCADMFVLVECSRAAVDAALRAVDGPPDELADVAAVAKVYCSRAATSVAESTIQVLGGIGYTWEHPAHLYLRRAKTLEQLFGDPHHHRDALAELHGL
ncbi:acyl-CoA dehydrogenase family protein [Pseudonocardia kunmingensis]|uniref:Alkylation response protein AidB-like acyl-CoA dehydrogenase n=1 Tax=Pseudonocardia kunmingensis TaxID=630975 RepID=A0A543DPI7_9PSEU|nr:acyl-CoA dehydrogenase family protein [Pseudonocardia kunmingensis]TQM11239.1 alkylation response protein AidB-like acyl-CoA dehydrogenase [Pseudonocardia kunmingensis]